MTWDCSATYVEVPGFNACYLVGEGFHEDESLQLARMACGVARLDLADDLRHGDARIARADSIGCGEHDTTVVLEAVGLSVPPFD